MVPAERHAARGAEFVAGALRDAVEARGRASVAFSGGSTAGPLLEALATADVPWSALDVFQVDERVAPAGHPDRNFGTLRGRLLDHVPLEVRQVHPMPVEALDLETAAAEYARTVEGVAGHPPILDVVHLGLGADGHTASLVPGLPSGPEGRSVVVTPLYEGRRRMTLTLPPLARARVVLWFVRGREKASIVPRLVGLDASIPAGRVQAARGEGPSLLLLDPAAAEDLPRD
ncbi:MAG: 6-phosphogluconolactonase [Gemmatimonadales bacterium]